jgi:hypothetical protein
MGAVQPDLVRSARLQAEFEEGEPSERLQAPVSGYCDRRPRVSPPLPRAGTAGRPRERPPSSSGARDACRPAS